MLEGKGIAPEDRQAAREAYLALNAGPMQRRLREKKEWFVGAVYWGPGDYDRVRLAGELKRMREVGFNVVRFHGHTPREIQPGVYDFAKTDDYFDVAAEVGIEVISGLPIRPSRRLLEACGISEEEFGGHHLDDPRMIAAVEACARPMLERYRKHRALCAWSAFGEPHAGDRSIDNDYDRARFAEWLRERYGTVEALDAAWNLYPEKGRPIVSSFEKVWTLCEDVRRGLGQAEALVQAGPFGKRNYGANRDMMRYLTDKFIARTAAMVGVVRKYDPDHPIRVGAHQLFANQAYYRWDTPKWARLGDAFGTSIHLSWHFEPVMGEVDRPVFMQARMTHDYLKGGFTAAYETTGGAVQYSGGYPNAMTPGLMRRLVTGYLAAGNQSLAFWTWNHRPGGWEVGEYGLTTLSGKITPWAREIGKAARGLEKYHEEIWDADNQTRAGILQSWDTDAILLQEPEGHDLQDGPTDQSRGTKMQASRARVGLARALINRKVPFEYVTDDEILSGIALCYPVIYAPHLRAVRAEVVEKLIEYVERGGRAIADVQFAFLDQWGKMHPTGEGGLVDRAFGAYIDVHHHTRTGGASLGAIPIDGLYGDLVPTSAKVIARFANGAPAIAEKQVGRGSAVLIAFDAARMCRKAGREDVEALIASLVRGDERPGWECDAPMAFRRAAEKADHYFLLNDGPARGVFLKAYDRVYVRGEDVLAQTPIDVAGTIGIDLPAESAMWIRFERA